jgi:LytS/YehU family sensor histidine kinase
MSQRYLVTTRSPQFMQDYGEAANSVLFSSDTLAAENHILVINITQCVNQTFILDYITYTPSFLTLASMPNLTNLPTTTFNSGASSTTSSGSQLSQSNVKTKIPIGAIVGGVLGGILFFVLIGFLLGYLRRNRGGHDANCECSLVLVIARYQ